MKPLILALILTISTLGQVAEVPQKFVDRANQAFVEVKALRELDEARKSEISAKNEQIRLQSLLIDSLKTGIEARDKQIEALAAIKCDTSQVKFLFGIVKVTKKSCR